MAITLSENVWEMLTYRINRDMVTPFLGAGAAYGVLPTGAELARQWASDAGYTFGNPENLVEVAQYLAVRFDPLRPKEMTFERFRKVDPPDFDDPDEPHGVLARLPLSVYLTTNYDDFLYRALKRHQFRSPVRDFCRWHEGLDDAPSPIDANFRQHAANPLVFHLHGMLDLERDVPDPVQLRSLVLTEDDYLQFLAARRELLPPVVRDALRNNSCLFIGYRLADWNLRVVLQGLKSDIGTKNVAVFPPPGRDEDERRAAREYFNKYFGKALDIEVYWGTAREFFEELRARLSVNL